METDSPLRILMVEDLPSDAELAERELRKGGILFTSKRVDTKEGFLTALEEFRPDLIISDYAMPEFDGMQALNLSLAHDPNLPFILLTGSMNEETAVACMKAGAADYVIKEHIARLPMAVSGALEQQKTRLEKAETAKELIAIYENAPMIMMLMDGDRRIHKVNVCASAFSGRSTDAMLRMRCGEALRCLHAFASPEGCGFGPQCEPCAIRRIVKDTIETGRCHNHVEGSLPYRSERQEGELSFLLSATKLNLRKQPLALVSILDITERKRADDKNRQQSEMLDSAPSSITVHDFNGKFLYANKKTFEIHQYDGDEFMGMNLREIDAPDSERLIAERMKLIDELGEASFEVGHFRKDRSIVPLEVYAKKADWLGTPALLSIATDITDRKKAEEALRASEKNFRQSLDESPFGVRIVSADGATLYVNRAILDIFGYDRIEELQTTRAVKRYTEQSYAEFQLRKEKRRLGKDDLPEYEIDIVRKDGDVRHLQVWRKSIFWNGKEHYQVIYRDITDRKKAEEALLNTTERLRRSLAGTVQAISMAVEVKDPYTSGHQRRMADLARSIATEMGLSEDRTDFVRIASTIHDIGKISVPAEILSKPTKLTSIEFSLIKVHAQAGYDILKDVEFPWPVADVVLQHHERVDGSGYPNGLRGDNILLEARIMAVADVVEAIASYRPYRPALGIDAALEEISKNRGILYDPEVSDACLKLFHEKGYRFN